MKMIATTILAHQHLLYNFLPFSSLKVYLIKEKQQHQNLKFNSLWITQSKIQFLL